MLIHDVPMLAKCCPSFEALGLRRCRELEEDGWTRWARAEGRRTKQLHLLPPNLYRTVRPATEQERWLQDLGALYLRAGPDAAVAAASAAALHGLDGFDHRSPLLVQVPARRHPRKPPGDGRILRTRADAPTIEIGPFSVTTVARTLADLHLHLVPRTRWPRDRAPIPPDDLVELALESALRAGAVDVEELVRCPSLRRVLWRRPPGAPPTESFLETRFVQLVRANRLPAPERQVVVNDSRGRYIGRIDFRIGDLLVECDGRETHDNAAAFEKDRTKWSRLQAEGRRLLVLTYNMIEREAERTCELITQALAA